MYWVGMGDYADCINPKDYRFDLSTIDPEFLPSREDRNLLIGKQFDWIRGRVEKIKEKCLGLHLGNHEFDIMKFTSYSNDVSNICRDFDIPYLGYDALWVIRIMKGKEDVMSCNIHSTHGSTGARYAGTKLSSVERWASDFDADIYLYGHSHECLAHRDVKLWTDGKELRMGKRMYAITGSFLRGYVAGTTSYVERKNMRPIKTGVVKLTIFPDRKDIHAET